MMKNHPRKLNSLVISKMSRSSIYVSKLLTIVDGAIAIIIDLYTMVTANTVVYYPKH